MAAAQTRLVHDDAVDGCREKAREPARRDSTVADGPHAAADANSGCAAGEPGLLVNRRVDGPPLAGEERFAIELGCVHLRSKPVVATSGNENVNRQISRF